MSGEWNVSPLTAAVLAGGRSDRERISALEAELHTKEEQLRVARLDSERLDWLESYSHLRITTTTVNGGQMKHIEGDGTALRASGGDLRDVIDAARTPAVRVEDPTK